MGFLVCPKHTDGNQFQFMCCHVAVAVRSDSTCRGVKECTLTDQDDPEIEVGTWLCGQCVRNWRIPSDGAWRGNFDEIDSQRLQPGCNGCFDEWYRLQPPDDESEA